MQMLNTGELNPVVAERSVPFFRDVQLRYPETVHSLYVVGSAVTPDFREKGSVIHSVIIIHKIDFDFIQFIASLGRKYGRKGIAAPLIMTPDYIRDSLNVFPIEFHDFQLIHKTVAGEDIFKDMVISKEFLKLQCEREVKVRLIGLRQSYITSLGDKRGLAEMLSHSVIGCMPLIRGVLFLFDKEPPVKRHDAIRVFQELASIDAGIFERLLQLRAGLIKPSKEELHHIFENYHTVLENVEAFIDTIKL
jgi:hypothetical protein